MKMEGQPVLPANAGRNVRQFPGLEDAVARSQEIADTVDIELELGKRYFPVFELPRDVSPEDELRDL